MFKVMTNKDLEEYMILLSNTNGEQLSGIEKQIEQNLRDSAQRRSNVLNQIEQNKSSLIQLQRENQELIGQMNAYALILQSAEDERRYEAAQEEKDKETIKAVT